MKNSCNQKKSTSTVSFRVATVHDNQNEIELAVGGLDGADEVLFEGVRADVLANVGRIVGQSGVHHHSHLMALLQQRVVERTESNHFL